MNKKRFRLMVDDNAYYDMPIHEWIGNGITIDKLKKNGDFQPYEITFRISIHEPEKKCDCCGQNLPTEGFSR